MNQLSRAQRKFLTEVANGQEYADDNCLSGSERRMIYRLVDLGLLDSGPSRRRNGGPVFRLTDDGRAALTIG